VIFHPAIPIRHVALPRKPPNKVSCLFILFFLGSGTHEGGWGVLQVHGEWMWPDLEDRATQDRTRRTTTGMMAP
jgi:hypothetical protein